MKNANTAEQESARDWTGGAEQFFATLEPRLIAFFMSADSSYQWNHTVQGELAAKLADDALIRYRRDGLEFVAVPSAADMQSALAHLPTADYRRYQVEQGQHSFKSVSRPTLVQTSIHLESLEEDDSHPGFLKLAVSFFLPSGCYATNVVNQWILTLCKP